MGTPTLLNVHFSGVALGCSKCPVGIDHDDDFHPCCSLVWPAFLGMISGPDFKKLHIPR